MVLNHVKSVGKPCVEAVRVSKMQAVGNDYNPSCKMSSNSLRSRSLSFRMASNDSFARVDAVLVDGFLIRMCSPVMPRRVVRENAELS